MEPVALIAGLVVAVIAAAACLWKPLRNGWRRWEARRAVRAFRGQREHLELQFFRLASNRGKPRGLRWVDCDWQDQVRFARDRHSGLLTAFVAVNLSFEAIEGGEMEDVEAVSTVRDATAVFHYRRGTWGTGGRALFNMNPDDAIERLADQYEPVPVPDD